MFTVTNLNKEVKRYGYIKDRQQLCYERAV